MIIVIVLRVIMLAVLVFLAREVQAYFTAQSELSPHRFVLRMTTGGIVLVLLGAILVGLTFLHLGNPHGHPILFACWWGGCGLLALALVGLALLEMREVSKDVLRHESQLWRDIAEEVAQKKRGTESR